MASQHSGGLFYWESILAPAAPRAQTCRQPRHTQQTGPALTEGQVALDTSQVGQGAGAADSQAPKARASDGGL